MSELRTSDDYSILSFITEHDGTQPVIEEAEALAAGQKFRSFVVDLHLGHAGEVTHLNLGYKTVDRLSLELPGWQITVESMTDPDVVTGSVAASDRVRASVFLNCTRPGPAQRTFFYRLYADGIVRRQDVDMSPEGIKQRRQMFPPTSTFRRFDEPLSSERLAGVIETAAQVGRIAKNGLENARLERQMGVNNQAIGLPEVDGLIDFLTQEAVPVRG